jgi:hypothetical protein
MGVRFTMECVNCGNRVVSLEGRKQDDLEEAIYLIDAMGLRCRECDGEVTARIEG